MEEFIDNFNQFRDWLYHIYADRKEHNNTTADAVLNKVVDKFEELGLNKVF